MLHSVITSSKEINFYREGNNFGYVAGEITFSGRCRNSIVISDKEKTTVSDLIDSFIIFYEGTTKVFPIRGQGLSEFGIDLLKGKRVRYNAPSRVFARENLEKKDPSILEYILAQSYGLTKARLMPIQGSIRRDGLFHIFSEEGEFVLKNLGTNEGRAKALFEVANGLPSLFPTSKKTRIGERFVRLNDGFYGLEEYIIGEPIKERSPSYYFELGGNIARMHQELGEVIEKKGLQRAFLNEEGHLSASNLIAINIDLAVNGYDSFLPEAKRIGVADLEVARDFLDWTYIHGDLNQSNVISTSKGLKFIDLELLRFSRRIIDFESPLLFGGNMAPPIYIRGSLKTILEGYNEHSLSPIKEEENEFLLYLLRYALLKNFVIRNIRRGEKRNSPEALTENLKLLEEDK